MTIISPEQVRRCVVCRKMLLRRQRLYCGRTCNHAAETRRRRARVLKIVADTSPAAHAGRQIVRELAARYDHDELVEAASTTVPPRKAEQPVSWPRGLIRYLARIWYTLLYIVGN